MDRTTLDEFDRTEQVDAAIDFIMADFRANRPGLPYELDVVAFLERRLQRQVLAGSESEARTTVEQVDRWLRAYVSSATSGGAAAGYIYDAKPILRRCQELVAQLRPSP